MEGSDAFASGVEIKDGEDPFEGTDFGDFGGERPPEDPVAPDPAGEAPAGELKTVDREGNPVEYDEAGTVRNEIDPATGEAAPLPPEQATADPTPPAESDGPTEPVAATPPAGEQPVPPTQASGSSPTTASPEEKSTSETGTGTPSGSSTEPEPEDAPVPQETTDAGGKKTKRRYLILQVEGQGKFRQVSWHVDGDGKMVPRGTEGSRRQAVALARGTDEALKIGFAALGAPTDGAQLVAVAALHFQPRKIKPLPPEPSKQRLQIS